MFESMFANAAFGQSFRTIVGAGHQQAMRTNSEHAG